MLGRALFAAALLCLKNHKRFLVKSLPKFILLIILLAYTKSICQNNYGNISGKIFDTQTKEGLPNVNIFFSKTTFGTTSNNNGLYSIKNLPAGKYTLVVSMIGYEPSVKKIEIVKDSFLTMDFFLKSKAVELNTVEIIGDKSLYEQYLREQYEYRKIFKKYFLGQTEFSEKCEILNEEKIIFKKNTLGFIEAQSLEPIIVINKALGYEVECFLDYFLCNDKKESVQMLFYPRFTELEPTDEDQYQNWEENRETVYLGSLRRFLFKCN